MNTNLIREILATRSTAELSELVEKYLTEIGEDDTGATYGELAERRDDDVLRAAEYWWNTLEGEGLNQIDRYADEDLVRQWLNCETVEIDHDGDIWVEGPMAGIGWTMRSAWSTSPGVTGTIRISTADITGPRMAPIDEETAQ